MTDNENGAQPKTVPTAPVTVPSPEQPNPHMMPEGAFCLLAPDGTMMTSPTEVWHRLDEPGRQVVYTCMVAMFQKGTVVRDHVWTQMTQLRTLLQDPDSEEHKKTIAQLEELYARMPRIPE